MLVTGYPSIEDGTAKAPEVDVETAVLEDEPPPMVASPLFKTVYVQVTPSTVALSALREKLKMQNAQKRKSL